MERRAARTLGARKKLEFGQASVVRRATTRAPLGWTRFILGEVPGSRSVDEQAKTDFLAWRLILCGARGGSLGTRRSMKDAPIRLESARACIVHRETGR